MQGRLMKASRLAILLALATVPSACEFRACGLGCGSNATSNIPETMAVVPQPLKVPDAIPGEHGLAAAWFDNAQGLLDWAKSLNPEKFPKEISADSLREVIFKQSGSKELAEGLDLSRPFGCVGFNLMEFMQGDGLPLSCVFHFKGGLKALEKALAGSSPKMEDEELTATVQGRTLKLKAWPTDDGIWLTGGKTLAMQAKPVLEQKLGQSQAGHKSRVELSLYVAQILSDYKFFARPMLQKALKDFSAGLPMGRDTVDETIDKAFNELENLYEFRVAFKTDDSEAMLFLSETMAAKSEQLNALSKACQSEGINPHLLGLLPASSIFVAAQNLDLSAGIKEAWTKETHEMFAKMMALQTGESFPHSHEEFSGMIHGLAEHFHGTAAASVMLLGPKSGALTLLYKAKSGQSPRVFWRNGFNEMASHLKEQMKFDPKAKEVTMQGVIFDSYRAARKSKPEAAQEAFILNIGELDGVGIVVATEENNIETATRTVVDAIKGKARFGDSPDFEALASKFAGNHIGVAADFIGVMNVDPNRKPKLQAQGLGDISMVMRGEPGKGVAFQISLKNSTIKALSQEM